MVQTTFECMAEARGAAEGGAFVLEGGGDDQLLKGSDHILPKAPICSLMGCLNLPGKISLSKGKVKHFYCSIFGSFLGCLDFP